MVNETVPKDILDKLNAGITISGVDLDIRDLTSVSDSVEVKQATAANLKTEIYNPAGSVLGIANYGYDGSNWESLNTDTNNRLLTSPTQTSTKTHNVYTFNEWLMENGTFRGDGKIAQDTTTTLYTVPGGKVFYLIATAVQFRHSTATYGAAYIKVAGKIVLYLESTNLDKDHGETAMNFSIPIKLAAGQVIEVRSVAAALIAVGSFAGYEVDA